MLQDCTYSVVSSPYRKQTNPRASHICQAHWLCCGCAFPYRSWSCPPTRLLCYRPASLESISLWLWVEDCTPRSPWEAVPTCQPEPERYHCLSRGSAQPAGATALVWKGFLVVRSSLVIRVSPPRMRKTPPHRRTSWHSPYSTKPRKACGTETAVRPGGHMPAGCNHSGWIPPDSPVGDCPPRAGRKVWSWKSWAWNPAVTFNKSPL